MLAAVISTLPLFLIATGVLGERGTVNTSDEGSAYPIPPARSRTDGPGVQRCGRQQAACRASIEV